MKINIHNVLVPTSRYSNSLITANKTLSLCQRSFKVHYPLLNLYSIMLAQYILNGRVTAGYMIDRILQLGLSPIQVAFSGRGHKVRTTDQEDGIVDT